MPLCAHDCTTADRTLLCSVLMACALDTTVQLGLSCSVHTSTVACRGPEATMTAFRKCSSTAQDRAEAVCEQPSACRSCIRSAAPLCPCSPAPQGDSARQSRRLNHGTSDFIGSCSDTYPILMHILEHKATFPGAMQASHMTSTHL